LFCEDTPNQTLLLIKILSEGVLGYSLLAGHIHSELLSKFATELMNKVFVLIMSRAYFASKDLAAKATA